MKLARLLIGGAVVAAALGLGYLAGALAMDGQPGAAPVTTGAVVSPASASAVSTAPSTAAVPPAGAFTELRPAQSAPSASADSGRPPLAVPHAASGSSSPSGAAAPRVAALSPPGARQSGAGQVAAPAANAPAANAEKGSDAAAGAPEQPTPGQVALRKTKDQSIVLDPHNWAVMAYKSRHELVVYFEGHLYKKYHAVFGRSLEAGSKEWSGDRRTPEGAYRIIRKRANRRWRYFLQINYPNDYDRSLYREMLVDGEVPKIRGRATPEGGAIGIHGTDVPILNSGDVNWTTGCISVDNGAIDELEALLPVGTLVIIKP